MVNLLPFMLGSKFKNKGKTVGVARQQLHFFVATKKTKQKKAWYGL